MNFPCGKPFSKQVSLGICPAPDSFPPTPVFQKDAGKGSDVPARTFTRGRVLLNSLREPRVLDRRLQLREVNSPAGNLRYCTGCRKPGAVDRPPSWLPRKAPPRRPARPTRGTPRHLRPPGEFPRAREPAPPAACRGPGSGSPGAPRRLPRVGGKLVAPRRRRPEAALLAAVAALRPLLGAAAARRLRTGPGRAAAPALCVCMCVSV